MSSSPQVVNSTNIDQWVVTYNSLRAKADEMLLPMSIGEWCEFPSGRGSFRKKLASNLIEVLYFRYQEAGDCFEASLSNPLILLNFSEDKEEAMGLYLKAEMEFFAVFQKQFLAASSIGGSGSSSRTFVEEWGMSPGSISLMLSRIEKI